MKKLLFLLLLPIFVFGQKEVVVHLTTDNYPTETYWILMKDVLYGDTIAAVSAGHYTSANTSYMDTIMLADSITDITFLIRDTYGDGIMAPGNFFISICGDTIISVPSPSFSTGMYWNRTVPQCLPNPPPALNCVPAMVNINLDQYQNETTWDIKDSSGTTLYSGGPYSSAPDYQPQFIPVCLPVGQLTFTIYDSYGDGLAGSLWGGIDGSYYLMQCGDTLVDGSIANFGTDSTHVFVSDTCTPPPPVPGCMDEDYIEYNPNATVDDSSCSILKVWGCTDSTMFNYDPAANTMDMIDSCDYTLILHDLVGNGWVGSRLEIYQDDTTLFYMSSTGSNQYFNIQLYAPEEVKAKFFVSAQAQHTALECGFTLINPLGDTVISVVPPFIVPFQTYSGVTYCGNTCVEIVEGCMDSLAFNYVDSANVNDDCYYYPGCISPAYLEYHIDTANGYNTDINIQDSCNTLAIFGCMNDTMYNYDPAANVDNGGCVAYIYGCMDPTMYNYNIQATASDTCIPYVYGCVDPTMFNYNPNANTDDGNCIPYVFGCMDSTAFNYNPLANTDNGSCIPIIYGCTNPIALNYCDSCNTDDFSCILPIYGCTDSTMFNFNPLANVDNGSCIPIVYGCTDPSMLNYNPQANTEDFSCIAYVYGCMDSTALNYDSLANTDNGSCITIITGCMDQSAYNYDPLANVNDSVSCLYAAGCVTGPGNPYWLNDPCYAWVISVDDYCCENEWDTICQSTYDYCSGTWTGPPLTRDIEENLIVYPNPTDGLININQNVDINVFNYIGDMIISETNTNVLDITRLSSGTYMLQIIYKNKSITKQIIKN